MYLLEHSVTEIISIEYLHTSSANEDGDKNGKTRVEKSVLSTGAMIQDVPTYAEHGRVQTNKRARYGRVDTYIVTCWPFPSRCHLVSAHGRLILSLLRFTWIQATTVSHAAF